MGREEVAAKINLTSCTALLTASPPFFAAIVPSDSTLPPPNRIRISVTFVGTLSFFGHGFFNAGVRRHVVPRFTREQHDPRIGQQAVVHEHGTWHRA